MTVLIGCVHACGQGLVRRPFEAESSSHSRAPSTLVIGLAALADDLMRQSMFKVLGQYFAEQSTKCYGFKSNVLTSCVAVASKI